MTQHLGKKLVLVLAITSTYFFSQAQQSYRLVPVAPKPVSKTLPTQPAGDAPLGTPSKLQDRYAAMMKVVPQALSEASLYKFIDQWYGVRYRFGGTTKSGIDCSAFVQKVYENVFGMSLLRTAWQQFNSCILQKNTDDLKEGDLVFFKIKSSRITHVGIYLRNNYFIHASSSKGVTISSLNDSYWSKYYAGGGKMTKENEEDQQIAEAVKELKNKL